MPRDDYRLSSSVLRALGAVGQAFFTELMLHSRFEKIIRPKRGLTKRFFRIHQAIDLSQQATRYHENWVENDIWQTVHEREHWVAFQPR